jgi:hypothetical protein
MFCNLHKIFVYVISALQKHNSENYKQIFPEKELLGLSPNSYIHVYVSD